MADERQSVWEAAKTAVQNPLDTGKWLVGAVMSDGSISAELRSGLKQIQDAYYDAAYGHSDHSREAGSSLTPLASDVQDNRTYYEDLAAANSPFRPDQPAKHAKAAVTVHGPAEKAAPAQSRDTASKPEVTVHGPQEDKAEKRKGEPMKVEFGEAWNVRVAAHREQAAQNRDMQHDPAKPEQQHERSRRP